MTTSPTATASMGRRRSAPSRRTSASAGARSINARIAPRARSIARTSSTWASANRNTTDAPSAHSPSAIAPATATIISTWMSRRPADIDVQARRSRLSAGQHHRGNVGAAARRSAPHPPVAGSGQRRGTRPTASTSRSRQTDAEAGTRLLVLEPGAHAGLRNGFSDPRGRQLRGVVLDPKALADDVGVDRPRGR